jgi:hypothetical protein
MPKNRPCSLGLASTAVALISADQNVSPVAIPQPAKMIRTVSKFGIVENQMPSAPANANENDINKRGATRSASQPLGI